MFDTSIHWTTFFYLLVDVFIVLLVFIRSLISKSWSMHRFIWLGFLFILYNTTGGFLPSKFFPGPLIIQYIITYSVAIILCMFIIYYIYKEYDIVIVKFYFTVRNISILLSGSFVGLFLIPYYITNSLFIARTSFTVPIALIGFYFLWLFHKELIRAKQLDKFMVRRNNLAIVSIASIVLLPILTLIGDYQWLTFSIMNISFYSITLIEIDRYLFFLENKHKIYSSLTSDDENFSIDSKFIYYGLTPREIEIAISILNRKSYKIISEDFFIAEKTASKHASNIFKKTKAKNKKEFLRKFSRA